MVNVPAEPGAYRLEKSNHTIYVGSAKNLLERFRDWQTNPQNYCVRERGWDNFVWQRTSTHEEARQLELYWFNQYRPICNLVTPPGTV